MKKTPFAIIALALCVILLCAVPQFAGLADTAVPVTNVYLSDYALILDLRESWLLLAEVDPENATNRSVTWDSSNRRIAVVDFSGKVMAVSPGTAYITATAADGSGKLARCRVVVVDRSATPTPVPAAAPTQRASNDPAPYSGVTPTPAPTATPKVIYGAKAYPATEKGGLNMRASTSTASNLICNIPQGAVFTVITYGRDWSYASYNGHNGYVMTRLFRFADNDATATPAARTPSPSPTAAPTATPKPPKGSTALVATSQGGLNMRVQPKSTSKRVTVIPHGALVDVLAHGRKWCQVRYNGMTGYVQTQFLQLGSGVAKADRDVPEVKNATAAPTATPKPKALKAGKAAIVVTASGGLNMRESGSSHAKRLRIIPQGAEVQVLETGVKWCRISYDGQTGYVQTKYLRAK